MTDFLEASPPTGGRVEVDSWGDDPAVIAAYEELGSAVVERPGGWQFQLG